MIENPGATGRPERRHLRRLERVWVEPPIYFVTVCSHKRRRCLAREPIAGAVMDGLRTAAESCRWRVGQYVVMPDHIHFFCAPRDRDGSLSAFVGWYKAWVTREAWRLGVQGRLWQPEFFDHLLRSALLYQQKWEYVRLNPVRAGLVQAPDEWPYSGQVDAL